MAADIGAPLLVAFVLFVLRRAREAGVQRLYFLSRRGELPLKIARVFQADFPEIELRYLYSSRWAWRPAAYGRWCRELWDDLMDQRVPMDLGQLLKLLGLGGTGIADAFMDRFSQESNTETMYEWLSQPAAVDTINESLSERGKLVLTYLDQEGMWDRERIGIVDDGWTGRTQRDLRWLLGAKKRAPKLHGYYLGMIYQSEPWHSDSQQNVFLHSDREGSIPLSPVRMLIWRYQLLEDVFLTSADRRCLGYTMEHGHVTPLFETDPDADPDLFTYRWHQTILDFAREWGRADVGTDDELLARTACMNTAQFFRRPMGKWAACIQGLNLHVGLLKSGGLPFVRPFGLRDVHRMQNWSGALTSFQDCSSYWPEGSLAISSRLIRGMVFAQKHGWRSLIGRILLPP